MSRSQTSPEILILVQIAAAVAVWLVADVARSQTPETPEARSLDSAVLAGGAPRDISGAIAVNAAAGQGNQQTNAAVLSIGEMASASALVRQHIGAPAPAEPAEPAEFDELAEPAELGEQEALLPRDRVASIESGAFAGASGLVTVNVAAGAENQQANLAAIAIGIDGPAVADTLLSQTRAAPEPKDDLDPVAPPGNASTNLGDGAFAGASGLVQVSLLGGERNSSANTFALTVLAGTKE